jgi:metal-responsive CopG/Arc/MetJ family transcriptional regulator
MGRKKVISSMKKEQVSVSLPRHIVERLDFLTSRRSQWILRAITARLDGEKEFETVETQRLIALLMGRFHGDVTKEEILLKWFNEILPESGE